MPARIEGFGLAIGLKAGRPQISPRRGRHPKHAEIAEHSASEVRNIGELLRQRQKLRYEIDLAENHRSQNAAPEK